MRYPLAPIKTRRARGKNGEDNESRLRNRPYLTWDIETVKWTKFLCVGIYDGKKFKSFRRLSDFLKYLFFHYAGFECYSHFGGKFDDLFLLADVLRFNSRHTDKIEISPILPRGSSIFSFDLTYNGSTLTFLDSSALLPFSLKRITKEFGVTHEKLEIDYTKIRKVTPKLLKYLEHDCKGLYEALEKFWSWSVNQKAGKASTIAAQSMRVLRTYLDQGLPYLSQEIDKHVRSAYFGGRTEIFKPAYRSNGRTRLYCYDVNSLYPFVMHENEFPTKYLGEVNQYVPNHFGIYNVEVEVPQMHIPPLCKVRKGKLIFPTGKFKTTLTSAEIQYSKSLGCEFRILNGWLFENGGKIFRRFVRSLYKIRETSEKGSIDNTVSKLLMNSCYGKFGQRTDREQMVFDDGSDGLKPLANEIVLRVDNKDYRLMLKDVEIECYSNVAIAAFVTAYARIHMHRLMRRAGDRLYYTDTDSLFTTKKFKTGTGLGKLKLEGEYSEAIFLLPKTYAAGTKIVMKGFEKKKLKDITVEDFSFALRGELERLKISTEPKFASFRTAVRSGNLTTLTKASTRQIRSQYDKRIIVKKGDITDWITKPIRLKQKGKEND